MYHSRRHRGNVRSTMCRVRANAGDIGLKHLAANSAGAGGQTGNKHQQKILKHVLIGREKCSDHRPLPVVGRDFLMATKDLAKSKHQGVSASSRLEEGKLKGEGHDIGQGRDRRPDAEDCRVQMGRRRGSLELWWCQPCSSSYDCAAEQTCTSRSISMGRIAAGL